MNNTRDKNTDLHYNDPKNTNKAKRTEVGTKWHMRDTKMFILNSEWSVGVD